MNFFVGFSGFLGFWTTAGEVYKWIWINDYVWIVNEWFCIFIEIHLIFLISIDSNSTVYQKCSWQQPYLNWYELKTVHAYKLKIYNLINESYWIF